MTEDNTVLIYQDVELDKNSRSCLKIQFGSINLKNSH